MSGPALATLLESVLGLLTFLLLIGLGIPTARPWAVALDSLHRTIFSWRRWLYLAIGLSILLANYAYLASGLDDYCTRHILEWRGTDFTDSFCRRIEGDAVARLQAALTCLPLTVFFAWVYVLVFPCLSFVAVVVFDHLRNRRVLVLILLAYLFNYLIVLPFYIAFPVYECHDFYARNPALAPAFRLLLDDISPAIMQGYRSMSGIDNCFPSFHTSLAVTLALIAWHDGRRSGALFTFLAAAVAVSTLYLGIHWITDAVGGIATAVVAYALALRASRRWAVGEDVKRKT
jgi:membrane-associated phospholipid phosphatase